jgi:hypothetical protein
MPTKSKDAAAVLKGLDVGATVHYVWPDSGHHHAALIANVLDPERGYVTLGELDHNGGFMQSPWVAYDADGAPGTWHPAEAKDDSDPLDPAGLNIDPDGRTPVPQGTQAEVDAARTDEERAADARVPRMVVKDDPVGHRTADVAKRTGADVDRSALTDTATERAEARQRDHGTVTTEPAARNAAAEPSARRAAELAQEKTKKNEDGPTVPKR